MNSAGFPDLTVMGPGGPTSPFQVPMDTGTPDTFGSFWYTTTKVGWDAPDMRATMIPLLGQEGEIPADNHFRGRSIVISGWAECPSEIARENSKLLLAAALQATWGAPVLPITPVANPIPNPNLGMLYVGESPSKVLFHCRSGNRNRGLMKCVDNGFATKTGPQSGTAGNLSGLPVGSTVYLVDFQFEVYCPDPFKYSGSLSGITYQTANFQGSATATSNGMAPTPIVATIDTLAPLIPPSNTIPSDPTVFWNLTTSQLMVFTVPIVSPPLPPMPASLFIDTGWRTISDGSVSRYELLSQSTGWWMLQPGQNQLSCYGGGSGQFGGLIVSMQWADRWL